MRMTIRLRGPAPDDVRGRENPGTGGHGRVVARHHMRMPLRFAPFLAWFGAALVVTALAAAGRAYATGSRAASVREHPNRAELPDRRLWLFDRRRGDRFRHYRCTNANPRSIVLSSPTLALWTRGEAPGRSMWWYPMPGSRNPPTWQASPASARCPASATEIPFLRQLLWRSRALPAEKTLVWARPSRCP